MFDILSDLLDRSGISNEFEMIDNEIQNSIIETWIDLTKKNL